MRGAELQLGCVFHELEPALLQWTAIFQVGPWIVIEGFPDYERVHRGRRVKVEIEVGFAYLGDVQLEFIHQKNDEPSPYLEFLATGREGLQHFGFRTEDYAGATQALLAVGMHKVYSSGARTDHNHTTYYELPGSDRPLLEVVESTPRRAEGLRLVKKQAENWDGQRPIRRFRSMAAFIADASGH